VGVSAKGTMASRNVTWCNNTFFHCSTNPITAGAVLIFTTDTNAAGGWTNFYLDSANGCKALNNVFLECGGTNTDRGWYTFDPWLTNIQADYNFVAKNGYKAVDTNILD